MECLKMRNDADESINLGCDDESACGINTKIAVPEDNWKHRSAGMRCQTCMYFAVKNEKVGRCRRHAPTMSGWPVMFKTDWCGDHKLDETKV
jgi:hypothetical protein